MSMNESSTDPIELLKNVTRETYRVGFGLIFILGIIGHVFNVRLFIRPALIKNSCCNYFLASSCTALIQLLLGVFVRMLDLGYEVDTKEARLEWWCKLRLSMIHTSYLISATLLTLASLDRYASSCRQSRYRRFCRPILARRIIVVVIVVVCLINCHMPFNLVIANGECWTRPGTYRIFFDIYFLVMHGVCYPLLSGTFGLLTINNLRRCRHSSQNKAKGFQLMTLAQAACVILLTMPFAFHKLYFAITDHHQKSSLRREWENLTMCIARVLWFMNDCIGFYIYTLSSRTFRKELITSVRGHRRKSYQVEPLQRYRVYFTAQKHQPDVYCDHTR
jgi:hypothetical protein